MLWTAGGVTLIGAASGPDGISPRLTRCCLRAGAASADVVHSSQIHPLRVAPPCHTCLMTQTPVPTSPATIGAGPQPVRGRSGRLPDPLVEGPAASCELLVEMVDTLRSIDRLTAKATELLERAQLTGEVEEQTGLPVEVWLSGAGRRTRSDRRMLTTTAELRAKLPSLADAFDTGRVSWAQVRAVVCACAKLPSQLLSAVDDALATEIESLADAEPDALVHVVSRAVSSLEPGPDATDAAAEVRERFLAIQPRLDGSGGSLYGEADAYGLAVLTEALDAGTPPPNGRLRDHVGDHATDEVRRARRTLQQGRRRMDALIAMAETSLFSGAQPGRAVAHGHGTSSTGPGASGSDPGSDPASDPASDPGANAGPATDHLGMPDGAGITAPKLLLTMSYETLVGLSDDPAGLLTTLTGGRMKVAADTARRLVDEAGAHLRTIVLEETGQVLGVGRRSYRPPGWLRDAALVRDETCRAPHCRTAARLCDLDHADPWTAHLRTAGDDDGGHAIGGPTDIVNLAHICRTDHGAKDRDGWHVYGFPDGDRGGIHRWIHRRTGLTIDTVPATRRLPIRDGPIGPPVAARVGPSP